MGRDVSTANKKTVRAILDAWMSGALSDLDDTLAPDVVLASPYTPAPVHGAAGVKAVLGEVSRAFPDGTIELLHLLADPSAAVAHYTLSGTHAAAFAGFPATQGATSSRQVALFRFRDGRVIDITLEFNLWDVLEDLGLLPGLNAAPAPLLWALAGTSRLAGALARGRKADGAHLTTAPAGGPPAGHGADIALVHRVLEEIFNQRRMELAYDIFTEDLRVHHPMQREPFLGVDEFLRLPRGLLEAYPDLTASPVLFLADGEHVAGRWVLRGTHTGVYRDVFRTIPPTRRRVTIPLNEVVHIAGDRICEMWFGVNILGVAGQLGVLPMGRARRLSAAYRRRPGARRRLV